MKKPFFVCNAADDRLSQWDNIDDAYRSAGKMADENVSHPFCVRDSGEWQSWYFIQPPRRFEGEGDGWHLANAAIAKTFIALRVRGDHQLADQLAEILSPQEPTP